jgi:hypothetical protein
MLGVKLLLVLDDLWEAEHERRLSFVDEAAGAKVAGPARILSCL